MNNFFSPDLIFFVMVAAFLVLRLRNVLGRRTGNEKKIETEFSFGSKVIDASLAGQVRRLGLSLAKVS